MRIKVQVDAKRETDDKNVFKGAIFIKIDGRPFAGTFDFQMEIVDEGGGSQNIHKIKESNQPVFKPETLAGTKGFLQKICQQSIEQAVDLMEERNTNLSTYAGNFSVDDVDAEEIKKFLRDTSGDPVN